MIIQKYGTMLLKAMGYTLLLTLLSLVFASIIGMIFGLMNVGHNRALNLIGTVYVDAVMKELRFLKQSIIKDIESPVMRLSIM